MDKDWEIACPLSMTWWPLTLSDISSQCKLNFIVISSVFPLDLPNLLSLLSSFCARQCALCVRFYCLCHC